MINELEATNRKVLVTGANGFLGQLLCRGLSSQGWRVKGAVRTADQFARVATANMVIGNIDTHTNWAEALRDIDVVIHLAARVHVMKEQAVDPLTEFLSTNLDGTVNLANQAVAAGVKRFVYVSTIKVNGEQTNKGRSFNELNPPLPQDSYSSSKWQAEQALHAIVQETGMEVVIVRPPLVYGPGVKANIAKLLSTIDRGIPLPLANVCNLRSMIYVGNLVDALIMCATHPEAAGKTYLVSDGEDVSTPELVRALAIALHKPIRVFPVPQKLMRMAARIFRKSAAIDRLTQSLIVDSSRIRNELGWQPPYTMAQGLQATADWYLQSISYGRP